MAITIGYLPQAIEFARLPVTVLVAVGGDMTARAALAACLGGWTHELRHRFARHLSSDWRLFGPDHKGRKASRSPGRLAY